MKTKLLTVILLFNLTILQQKFCSGQIPKLLNFQAVLTDDKGEKVPDGTYEIKFTMFDSITAIWEEIQNLDIKNGIVQTNLGKEIPLDFQFDKPVMVGITVDNEDYFSKIQLTPVPYSFNSMNVVDKAITASKLADTTVVRSLNDLKDKVIIKGGNNISVGKSYNDIVISAISDTTKGEIKSITAGYGLLGGGTEKNVLLEVEVPLILQDSVKTDTINSNVYEESIISGWNYADGTGVKGYGKIGLSGEASSYKGYAVYGTMDDNLFGYIASVDKAVYGENINMTGYLGGSEYSVYGKNTNLKNWGYIGADKLNIGVYGAAKGEDGIGVKGANTENGHYGLLGSANYGVEGKHNSGNIGRLGTNSDGAYGYSQFQYGVRGESEAGNGLFGKSKSSYGVYGESKDYSAVYGASETSWGVGGTNTTSSNAAFLGGTDMAIFCYNNVPGETTISATSNGGYAARMLGNVQVTGTLYKGGGAFKIDHPLDPENKYLLHSFVESPDMMNVYNGNIVLDENGTATVELPDWFEALNKEFRYQLTCIGGYAPVYISEEITGNHFCIAGGIPGLKVSWLVTGVRHDEYAETHRIPVEEEKTTEEKGKYEYPEAFGQPKSKSIYYEKNQERIHSLKTKQP